MSIMTQLEFELDFSHSEKEIAHYILNEGEKVLNLSIKELAKKTYTSPATIVRLCHKLGLEGYGDFKIKYSAELQFDLAHTDRIDVNFPFNEEDNDSMIAYKLASLNQEVIAETIQLIDFEQLHQIVELLDQNKDIDIYGTGNSLLAAMSFQHKMMRIRNVNLKMLAGEQVFMSYNSNENKIAMIISYSGETNEIKPIVERIKINGGTIIAITSLNNSFLRKNADICLTMCSKENIINKIGVFSSKISSDYIIDLIYSMIFQKHYHDLMINKVSMGYRWDYRRNETTQEKGKEE